jgi:hypothetical protein
MYFILNHWCKFNCGVLPFTLWCVIWFLMFNVGILHPTIDVNSGVFLFSLCFWCEFGCLALILFILNDGIFQESDYGTYMCYGVNSKGNDSRLISVEPPEHKLSKLFNFTIINNNSNAPFHYKHFNFCHTKILNSWRGHWEYRTAEKTGQNPWSESRPVFSTFTVYLKNLCNMICSLYLVRWV